MKGDSGSRHTRSILAASDFEFRNRFWMIGLVFGIGFWAYALDHMNVVQYLIDRNAGPHSPRADTVARAFFAFGALCILAAALIRTWAAAYLRTVVVQDRDVRSEALVADGPYRHVRNPLYLGNLFLALGFGLLASRLGFIVMVLGMTLFCLRLIALEESRLAHEQGQGYREFCRRVPSLFPALRPRVPSSGLEPQWRQAFMGEAFVWGFFLGLAAFAVTLKPMVMWVIVGLVLVVSALQNALAGSRRKAAGK